MSAASAWWCRTTRCFRTCGSRTTSPSACRRARRRQDADRRAGATNACALVGMSKFARALSARTFAAASSSASRSRGRWRSGRACCCSTSRCRRSTRRSAASWSTRSPSLHRDLPDLTVLYVTHDQTEALTLADRIAIMHDGRLSAFGPSQRPLSAPAEPLRRRVPRPRQSPAGGVEATSATNGLVARALRRRPAASWQAIRRRLSARRCLLCVRPQTSALAGGRAADQHARGRLRTCSGKANSRISSLDVGDTLCALSPRRLRDAARARRAARSLLRARRREPDRRREAGV